MYGEQWLVKRLPAWCFSLFDAFIGSVPSLSTFVLPGKDRIETFFSLFVSVGP